MKLLIDGVQIEGEPEDIARLMEKLRKPVNPFEPFYPSYPEEWIPPLFSTCPSHPYYTYGLVY